jgi:hypothetical protein
MSTGKPDQCRSVRAPWCYFRALAAYFRYLSIGISRQSLLTRRTHGHHAPMAASAPQPLYLFILHETVGLAPYRPGGTQSALCHRAIAYYAPERHRRKSASAFVPRAALNASDRSWNTAVENAARSAAGRVLLELIAERRTTCTRTSTPHNSLRSLRSTWALWWLLRCTREPFDSDIARLLQ